MIGFFDSGVGGLTIMEEAHKLMPEYSTLYLGDSLRAPYGEKTHKELVAFLQQGATWLFDHGCSLVIVACNSASASALREVQQTWLPQHSGKKILGVIRPTVEAISSKGFKRVLVLSTEATAESGAYPAEFKKINPNTKIISHACPTWGPMVEQGFAGSVNMQQEVRRELARVRETYDAVLLACTHFPYVKSEVEDAVGAIPVFNQGDLVAQSLKEYLTRHSEVEKNLKKHGHYAYFTTGDPVLASRIASDRFGFNVTFHKTSPQISA